jgi:hypothetical protein
MVHAKAMLVQTKKLKPYKSASSIKPQLVSAHIKPRVIVAKVVSKPLVKSHAVGSTKAPLKVAQKSPR